MLLEAVAVRVTVVTVLELLAGPVAEARVPVGGPDPPHEASASDANVTETATRMRIRWSSGCAGPDPPCGTDLPPRRPIGPRRVTPSSDDRRR